MKIITDNYNYTIFIKKPMIYADRLQMMYQGTDQIIQTVDLIEIAPITDPNQ